MRFLNNALIRDHYDVVVIGAGVGGLTAAALLAKRGVKVLVIEQHYIPGGCCTIIRRNDITFDVGAAVFVGCGERGFAPHRFVMNHLEEEIDLIRRKSIYRLHLDGKTVSFWRDLDRYLDELTRMFPNQDKELRSLYADMKDFYEKRLMNMEMFMPPSEASWKDQVKPLFKDPLGMALVMGTMFQSAEKVLKKHVTDPKVIAFFDYLMRFFTCCVNKEAPAIIAMSMFIDTHLEGACYAQGAPQMLPNRLEKAIEQNGGEILYRHMVDEILVEKGTAYGVRLADGTEIMADRVLANATVWNLYGKLVKPRHISPKRLAWAQKFVPTTDLFLIYLGVRAEAIPADAQPVELLVENIYDFQADNYGVFIPSLEDPSIAPPGTHSMTIMAPSKTSSQPQRFGSEYQSEEYYRRKREEAEKVIDDLERMYFTNLRKNILCMEAATPATLERFTLKNWGNIGGPKLSKDQFFMNRLKARSDWKNLYLCGDSTTMGEGVVSTTTSGVGAANVVLRDMGLPEYRPRPFARQYLNYVEGKAWTPPPHPDVPITAGSAVRLARECQLCEKPGCMKTCPAGIDVLNFLRRVEAGNLDGAARSMREMNPLAEICGYICPAEKLCQRNCNRLEFSEHPVRIADLHAWVCGQVSTARGWDRFIPVQNHIRVAIVGAGPAGLSCAHFLARAGFRVDILEKATRPGGMLSLALPTFRLSEDIVKREINGLTLPGIHFHFGKAFGKDCTVAELEKDYDALFLAPGLWSGCTLKIKGMKGAKTADALSMLCCYREKGRAEVGKGVLVVGGGSVATDAALAARNSGAEKVILVCLEKETEMPALASEVAEMKKQGVTIHNGWGPKAFMSNTRMAFVGCTSVFDDQNRFSPSYDESRSMEIEFDQVIWAVGQTIEPELGKYLKKEFGSQGLMAVNKETMQVEGRPGIFAGGDIVRGAGTVVEAVADGRRAAMAIHAQLRQKSISHRQRTSHGMHSQMDLWSDVSCLNSGRIQGDYNGTEI